MKKIAIALTLGVALLGGTALQARDKLTGEERLAKILDGRVAGQPVDCINLHQTHSSRVIDRTAIVYNAGSVIYVNRPRNAQSLDSDDIMVVKPTGSQLCKLDIVQTRDRSQMFFSGVVDLDQFVPYRRVASRN